VKNSLTTFVVSVRATGEVIGSFDSRQSAEWFMLHNLYMPEELEIVSR